MLDSAFESSVLFVFGSTGISFSSEHVKILQASSDRPKSAEFDFVLVGANVSGVI